MGEQKIKKFFRIAKLIVSESEELLKSIISIIGWIDILIHLFK